MSIDPMMYLARFIVRPFLESSIAKDEKQFILENVDKHRKAFWITAISAICVFIGLRSLSVSELTTVVSALIAPVMLLGTAWFAISFGGVPTKLLHVAVSITFFMFTAFLVSLTTMFVAISFISPSILYPVFALIYVATVVSCIQYDCTDALKVGLDDALLRHSRAAIRYYQEREGINIDENKGG